jgi:transposase
VKLVAGPLCDDCWEWQGLKGKKGYGGLKIYDALRVCKRRTVLVHRISYELFIGPIPEGLGVLHKCDNPPCCNPNHLFIGTNADNRADCVAKDRHSKGEQHTKAKLTEQHVIEIKALLIDGMPQRKIAKKYGVGHTVIGSIKNGLSWKHLLDSTNDVLLKRQYQRGETSKSAKLTEQQVIMIKALVDDGANQQQLAERYGVRYGAINAIKRGTKWKHLFKSKIGD